jgi:peptidoglycan hydrolase FlgJ
MTGFATSIMPSAPGATALMQAKAAIAQGAAKVDAKTQSKVRNVAQNFESVFLNTIFQQMFTAIGNDGPLGGGPGVGVWRSFLTDEYARSFAKAGGVGIGDQVYRELIAQQAARTTASVPATVKSGAQQ